MLSLPTEMWVYHEQCYPSNSINLRMKYVTFLTFFIIKKKVSLEFLVECNGFLVFIAFYGLIWVVLGQRSYALIKLISYYSFDFNNPRPWEIAKRPPELWKQWKDSKFPYNSLKFPLVLLENLYKNELKSENSFFTYPSFRLRFFLIDPISLIIMRKKYSQWKKKFISELMTRNSINFFLI